MHRRQFIVGTLCTASLASRAIASPVRYNLQPEKSRVGFVYRLQNNEVEGNMPVKAADIRIDLQNLARSSVDVSVDVRQAKAGVFFATEALKSESVLDARRHPTIRFRSNRIILNGQGRLSDGAVVEGDLTIRGQSRTVRLAAGLFRQKGTDADDLSNLSFRLTGRVNRSDFGASGYPKLVADRVDLDIVARVQK